MARSIRTAHVGLAEALAAGPPKEGHLAVDVFAHGSLSVEMYTPVGVDLQAPHARDEAYVVARGTGSFFDGAEKRPVEPGTFLFVPG